MAKRQREEDKILVTVADLEKYIEELEWIAMRWERADRCATPDCWRLVPKHAECKDCGQEPTHCVLCAPGEFGHCDPDDECGDTFCKLHGNIATGECDECREGRED
jgi:hypothetical protein